MCVQVDYIARYLRGWRVSPHTELPDIREVHELHPEPFGGLQVGICLNDNSSGESRDHNLSLLQTPFGVRIEQSY